MSRKQPKRRAGRVAPIALAGLFIFVVACGVGFGVASADSSDELAQSGAFGFDEATHAATSTLASTDENAASADTGTSGRQALASTSSRDITAGLAMVDEREAVEKARVEADNKAAIERVADKKAMQGVDGSSEASSSSSSSASGAAGNATETVDEYNLSPVDWSIGRQAFVEEWGARINAYLDGTVLAGYGFTFAEAAWSNGVDPRWSPAISNTESGNGAHCFLPHNAWGWGSNSWPDWETAINEHVAGLAESYGYSVTYAAAQKYCPPNSVHWYNNTLGQMSLI